MRDSRPEVSLSSAVTLDQLIANFLRSARKLGAAVPAVRSRLRLWLELQPPDHFLLIEPDEELRQILTMEMRQAVTFPVRSCGLDDSHIAQELEGAVPVALPNRVAAVRKIVPAGRELVTLQVRSVPASLADWLPAPSGFLIGVASRWPHFLKVARTILVAAGFHPDGLLFRDARKPNWQRGLKETAAVVCDCATAAELPITLRVVPFPLLSDTSNAELRQYQEFIRSPLVPWL